MQLNSAVDYICASDQAHYLMSPGAVLVAGWLHDARFMTKQRRGMLHAQRRSWGKGVEGIWESPIRTSRRWGRLASGSKLLVDNTLSISRRSRPLYRPAHTLWLFTDILLCEYSTNLTLWVFKISHVNILPTASIMNLYIFWHLTVLVCLYSHKIYLFPSTVYVKGPCRELAKSRFHVYYLTDSN